MPLREARGTLGAAASLRLRRGEGGEAVSKYTRGPWHVNENDEICDSSGESILWGWDDGSICGDKADIRLAAAAPDLLEALKEAEEYVAEYACGKPHRVLQAVQAAIAKAEGR